MSVEAAVDHPLDLTLGLPLTDLLDGAMVTGMVGGEAVLLARQGDEVFALSAKCSHYGGPIAKGIFADGLVRCPLHHARFDVRTGKAVGAPVIEPIACWTVERQGDRLMVVGKRKLAIAPAPRSDTAGRNFVIVGAGASGFAAAVRLRDNGFAGNITVFASESSLPIDRPNLSKDYLSGKISKDWVTLKPQSFYDEANIQLELGATVTHLNLSARTLMLASGIVIAWDRLLLATGAEPIRLRIPGADLPHVHTLRSLDHCEAIAAAATPKARAVIIGAGFIGLEVAAALIERGLSVHVVAPGHLPLVKQLGDALGEMVRSVHEQRGVVFHFGRKPVAITAASVELDDGTILDADIVVMGVGVRPRTGLAEQAGLVTDNGIVVSQTLETSAGGVFAAGDVARYPAPSGQGSLRVEHWAVAENLGQVAADNMLGNDRPFQQTPFFWSRHFDALRISYVGNGEGWDEVSVDGSPTSYDCTARYYRSGRLVAVASVGRDRESLAAELDFDRAVTL